MLRDILQTIGLNEKEARIYLALLELGETSIERISEKAKIKRTTLYDVVNSLKEKGLLGWTIKNKKRYYFAVDPRELQVQLEQKIFRLKQAMPELLSITNLIDKKPQIRFYEGVEGLKEVYLDTLQYPNQPLWAWVTTEDFLDVVGKEFADYYVPLRVKNKTLAYVIVPNSPSLKGYIEDSPKSLRKIKIDYNSSFATEIDLYGGSKIGFISFSEKVGLIVDSKKIYDTLKNIFDVHWNSLN